MSQGGRSTRSTVTIEKIRKLERELVSMKRALLEGFASSIEEIASGGGDVALTFLLVSSSNRAFAFPIIQVEEVLQMTAVNQVSTDRAEVLGLVDYHGDTIAVLDFRTIVGQPREPIAVDKSLVICEVGDTRFGLMVDNAADVVTVSREDLKVSEEVLFGSVQAVGIIPSEVGTALIVDVWSLLIHVQAAEDSTRSRDDEVASSDADTTSGGAVR